MKNSSDFNILSLQSEFNADEMGKITAILSDTQKIEINRSAAEDFIRILNEHHNESKDASPASALSDDDFRNLSMKLKNKK